MVKPGHRGIELSIFEEDISIFNSKSREWIYCLWWRNWKRYHRYCGSLQLWSVGRVLTNLTYRFFFLKLCKIFVYFTWLPKWTRVPWVATNWAFILLLIEKKSSCIHRMSLKKRVLLYLREIRRKMLWNWNFPPYVANLFDLKTDFTLKTVRPS